jgi:hypothetical protein
MFLPLNPIALRVIRKKDLTEAGPCPVLKRGACGPCPSALKVTDSRRRRRGGAPFACEIDIRIACKSIRFIIFLRIGGASWRVLKRHPHSTPDSPGIDSGGDQIDRAMEPSLSFRMGTGQRDCIPTNPAGRRSSGTPTGRMFRISFARRSAMARSASSPTSRAASASSRRPPR